MKAKKADISINMIVYIAIALLVLILVVAFITGGFGQMFKTISKSAPQDLEAIKSVCTQDCQKVKASVESIGTNAWKSSRYCSTKHGYDSDKNGDLSEGEYISCWEPPIGITCTVSTRGYIKEDDTTKSIADSNGCSPEGKKADGLACTWTPTYEKKLVEKTIICGDSKSDCELGCS